MPRISSRRILCAKGSRKPSNGRGRHFRGRSCGSANPGPDPRANLYSQSVDIIAELHDQASQHELLVLATTQLNDRMLHNKNHLMRCQPPIPAWVFNGTHKYNVATGMLGLFKPLRGKRVDETAEEFKAALTEAAKGTIGPQGVLEPDTMGITLMKGRYGVGQNEGKQARLRVVGGRLMDRDILEFGRYDV